MKFEGYHTALVEPDFEGPKRSFWTGNGNMAFTADLMDGLPEAVQECAAIYGEPPWRPGYETFARRAGVEVTVSWGHWMSRYSALMRKSGKPACAMLGKQAIRHIEPDDVIPIKLSAHGDHPVFLALWNEIVVTGETTDEVSSNLARRYHLVADLCCGFGRSSRLIAEAGGNFVAVDFNPLCIGYIAAHGRDWCP